MLSYEQLQADSAGTMRRVAAFLGGDGGEARALCDVSVVVGGRDSAAIQEVHQFLMHACCEQFETDSNT